MELKHSLVRNCTVAERKCCMDGMVDNLLGVHVRKTRPVHRGQRGVRQSLCALLLGGGKENPGGQG
uniref:Uncharacterized protein n=1 Tax=Anguilla anguilla TaxID=7936 RepID=A0A0E9T8V8_ANGAN